MSLDKEVFDENDIQYENDKKYYWELKNKGVLKDNHWVVIRKGKLLIQTPDENIADEINLQNGFCLVWQVGDEDHVVEI